MSRTVKNIRLGCGLHVVEDELSLLMTAMRRGVRWSSHSHQDEDQSILLKGLQTLKETLHDARSLSQLEPSVFLTPFLEIIRSEEITGPITSLALAAMNKMISYGLIDHEHPAIAPCVEAIADSVTHARFVGTDASGDGVVLMRILQVLRALVLSPAGDHLSDDSICEIMLSSFRICFETRLIELLRRTAEHCLRDMCQHLFIRLPHFADDTRVLPNMKKMRTNGIENSRTKPRKNKMPLKPKITTNSDEMDEVETKELLSPVDRVRANHLATTPITPAGNIVDMQGSLNQNTPEKSDEENIDKVRKNLDPKPDIAPSSPEPVENDKITQELTAADGEQGKSPELEVTTSEKQGDAVVEPSEVCNKPEEPAEQLPQNEGDTSPELPQSPTGSVDDLSVDDTVKPQNASEVPTIKIDTEHLEEYINQQGVRFTPLQQKTPYGALCIRELFRFLVSICNPLDKQNTEAMTHTGLTLLQVALELSADAVSNFSSLLSLVKDELCRNLILLLNTERVSILAVVLQVSYLLFESQRSHLKFQLEHYILKLMEIVNSDSNRITYEARELALEAITRLWRIPGLPAELYLNYDCGLYSNNLYEELMKMLSKNVSALMGTMYSIQFISLDAIIQLIFGIEARCKGYSDYCKPSRHPASANLPSRDELKAVKANKRWLAMGTEKFNENPREGVAKLMENGLITNESGGLDAEKLAKLLRENPMMDKKAIGEYISRKENTNILNCFVQRFDFHDTRIDHALRLYLESFRLPGEAPLISLLLEKFADHWHDSNGRPFASADAAFTLAYAVIMLNVDQHNHNAKKQSNPMTAEEFKKNLKKVNGEADFDQDMLDDIYNSIKNEEIVMPAEQTGLVKENYLWKVLLKRGASPESLYLKVGNESALVDQELAERAWAPIISALCRAYDKAPDRTLQRRVAQTFLCCAAISSHYNMNSDLDTLIVSICKFTGLATGGEPDQVVLHFGGSGRCQLAARTLFKITHSYGNGIRASWKNIIDCMQTLYKTRLLPQCLTDGADFIDSAGKVSLIKETLTPKQPPQEQGIFSSLYSYIALDTRTPHPAEATTRKRATECIANCNLKQIIIESKFLEVDSLKSLVGAIVSVNSHDEDVSVFLLEILLEVAIQNRDRVTTIWSIVLAHIDGLLTTAARENQPYLLERVAVGMLRLAIRLLRSEEFANMVLPPLIPLTHLQSATMVPLSRQIAFGLFELLKTGAANIHTTEDWRVIFNLLECSGAGALVPKQQQGNTVLEETCSRVSVLDQRPISPVPEWVLVSPTGTEAPLPVAADTIVLERDLLPHDAAALVKCCESLMFLVRDVAHVTPFNFELCIHCIRTFAEAVLQTPTRRVKLWQNSADTPGYQQCPMQLLELMHTLHTRTAQIFRWWAEENQNPEHISLWPHVWRPLLQGIARLCCDSRRAVRAAAITYLQSTLLAHDLNQLSAIEWSQCLEQVLFPLLAQLLSPICANDPVGVEETRVRAAMLLSKVFLHHLTPLLTLSGFLPLWLTVLDLLRAYMHADNSELLFEAIPESLKNMLLVMSSTSVLTPSSNLWEPTWRTINNFLPDLKDELFPEPPKTEENLKIIHNPSVLSLIEAPKTEGQCGVESGTSIPLLVPVATKDVGLSTSPSETSVLYPVVQQPDSSQRTKNEEVNAVIPQIVNENDGPSFQLPSQLVIRPVALPQSDASTMQSNELKISENSAPLPLIYSSQQQRLPSPSKQLILPAVQPIPEMQHNIHEEKREECGQICEAQPILMSGLNLADIREQQQMVNLLNQPPPSVSSPVAIQPTAQTFEFYHSGSVIREQSCEVSATGYQQVLSDADGLTNSEQELSPSKNANQATKSTSPSNPTAMFNSAAYFAEDPAADKLFVVSDP